jgi:hypothetical protein
VPQWAGDMGRTFVVRIDLSAVKAHLEREDRQAYSEDKVLQWLNDAGFQRVGTDRWQVSEAQLGHLDPSEVLEAEVVA